MDKQNEVYNDVLFSNEREWSDTGYNMYES